MLFINTHFARWLAVAAVLVTASPLFAQQYSIEPNDSIVANAPLNDLSHFNITQTNLAGTKLVFSWRQVELSIPTGWAANLCDNGHCYTDFPPSGTMDTVYSGDIGLMSASIDPGQVPGTAVIRYALWEQSSPNHIDTLTWIITATNTTGIAQATFNESFYLYPNPATGFVQLSVHAPGTFILTNIQGQQLLEGILKTGLNTINTHNLPVGNYTLTISDNAHTIKRQLTITH